MSRPITTLFMLMSVDGKITTGDTDTLNFDKDLPKIGVNDRDTEPTKIPIFIYDTMF